MKEKEKPMNRRAMFRLWLVAVLVHFIFPATTSLQAQEPGFTETFDDPALLGWEHSPNATIVDGVLRIEPGEALSPVEATPKSEATLTAGVPSSAPVYQSTRWVRTGGPIGGLGW